MGRLRSLVGWEDVELVILTIVIVLMGLCLTAEAASPSEMFGATSPTHISPVSFNTLPQFNKPAVYTEQNYNQQQTYPVGIFRGGCAGGCSNCAGGSCSVAGACGQAGCGTAGTYNLYDGYNQGGYGITGRRSRPLLWWRR